MPDGQEARGIRHAPLTRGGGGPEALDETEEEVARLEEVASRRQEARDDERDAPTEGAKGRLTMTCTDCNHTHRAKAYCGAIIVDDFGPYGPDVCECSATMVCEHDWVDGACDAVAPMGTPGWERRTGRTGDQFWLCPESVEALR